MSSKDGYELVKVLRRKTAIFEISVKIDLLDSSIFALKQNKDIFKDNMYDVAHCTVNFQFSNRGQSGVIFKGQHVLTTAQHLLQLLNPTHFQNITEQLANQVLIGPEVIQDLFKDVQTKVTFKHEEQLMQKDGVIKYIFNSRKARAILAKILQGFKLENASTELDSYQLGTILSSFVIISLNSSEKFETKNQILQNILMQSGHQVKIHKLDEVYTKATLFGHDSFFESINYGIVSNLVGDDASLLILSMGLTPGAEGGGVFKRRDKLLAIIVSSGQFLKKDNVQLTMAVRYDELINELLQQGLASPLGAYISLGKSITRPLGPIFQGDHSTVLIDSMNSWGCGCLVRFRGVIFILTCSHVVESTNSPEVLWKHGRFKSNVIYKGLDFTKAFDIALLSVPAHVSIPHEYFAQMAKYLPVVGSKVFSIGFPLISSFAEPNNFSPSVFVGRVTKYSTGILWTDTQVQAGQSGGPVFDANGLIIGVSVSNTRDETNQRVFPYVNMAVPICDIYRILEKFFETKDKTVLNELLAPEEIQLKWSLDTPKYLSKL